MPLVSDDDFQFLIKKRFCRSSDSKFLVDYPFQFDRYIIKRLSDGQGNEKIRLTYMKSVKTKNLDTEDVRGQKEDFNNLDDGFLYNEKLESSLQRSKRRIFELAFCNAWEYFFTGTFDAQKIDRSDIDFIHKNFTQFIRNYNRLHNCKIKFLIVPEMHKDCKSWHFHGFIMGLPQNLLFKLERKMFYPFTEKKIDIKIINELQNGYDVFLWSAFEKKYGFCSLSPIKSHEAVSKYCTKYITKEILKRVNAVGCQVYYRSRGLNEPETIAKGFIDPTLLNSISWDIENEFCKSAWIEKENLEKLLDILN